MKIHFPVVLIGLAAATLFAGCGGGGAQMTPPMPAASHQSAAAAPASTGVSSDPLGQVPATTYISKARAEYIALRAVGGGTVTLAVLETADYPVHWSIDITNRRGDFEVWVDARTGRVLKIIVGG